MLVNSKKLFEMAQSKKCAIPAVNYVDYLTAKTYVEVAEKRKLPLILAFAQSHIQYLDFDEAVEIGLYLANKVSVPIVLHLDHGVDLEFIQKAIEAGFSSVMIDGSFLPLEENIAITKKVLSYAHQFPVVVEAEIGHVGANSNHENHAINASIYTDVREAQYFVSQCLVDSLAVSIGTAHGLYKGEPKLSFDVLKQIATTLKQPLVLHGGSSSGDDNLKKCALNGIVKINIFTDLIVAATQNLNTNDYFQLRSSMTNSIASCLDHYYDVFMTNNILNDWRDYYEKD